MLLDITLFIFEIRLPCVLVRIKKREKYIQKKLGKIYVKEKMVKKIQCMEKIFQKNQEKDE